MKFTVIRDNFFTLIQKAGTFTSYKLGDMDSLKGVYIAAKKDGVEVRSTNITDTFIGSIGGKVEKTGEVLVDYKTLFELIRTIQEPKIFVEKKRNGLIIKTNKGVASLACIDSEAFPAFEESAETKGFSAPKKMFFNKEINLVLFASAKDETRPMLTGVCFDFSKDDYKIVATDGFRLSVLRKKRLRGVMDSFEGKIVIPSRSLESIQGGFSKDVDKIFIDVENKKGVFIGEDTYISSRFLDGDFPPYERVIPQDNETRIVFRVGEVLGALKTVALFAKERSSMVRFIIEGNSLLLSSLKSSQGEASFKVQLESREGVDNEISFNYRYVQQFLSMFPVDESVVFEMSEQDKPGVFHLSKTEDFLHIIMPIRSQE